MTSWLLPKREKGERLQQQLQTRTNEQTNERLIHSFRSSYSFLIFFGFVFISATTPLLGRTSKNGFKIEIFLSLSLSFFVRFCRTDISTDIDVPTEIVPTRTQIDWMGFQQNKVQQLYATNMGRGGGLVVSVLASPQRIQVYIFFCKIRT